MLPLQLDKNKLLKNYLIIELQKWDSNPRPVARFDKNMLRIYTSVTCLL